MRERHLFSNQRKCTTEDSGVCRKEAAFAHLHSGHPVGVQVSSITPPVTANLAPPQCAVVFPRVAESVEWHPTPRALSLGPLREEYVSRINLSCAPSLQIGSPITCPSHRKPGQKVPILGHCALLRALVQ